MNNNNFEGALSWDSPIEQESSFVLLEPGTYRFKVDKMERSNYQPSPTSSIRDVCPKAELTLSVTDDKGQSTNIRENLILHTKMEWKISEFFIAIDKKQPGQPVTPNWSMVVGSSGWAEVEINKYKDQNGNERENNRISRFLPPAEVPQSQPQFTQQAQTYQQPPAQTQTFQSPQQTQIPQQPQNPTFDFS